MEVRHYEYRLVEHLGYDIERAESQINKLAAEGFRVIKCAGAGVGSGGGAKYWMWTLEREILPDHPYR